MFPALPAIVGPLLSGLVNVIDKAVEDKDQATAIKARLNELALSGALKELESAAQIIVAEAQGESWLQRNWRPLLMVMFGVIIANNYILVPIFN
ncbi:MAG TPA: 3TM-type holin, partial [Magnetovibrio sp.]